MMSKKQKQEEEENIEDEKLIRELIKNKVNQLDAFKKILANLDKNTTKRK